MTATQEQIELVEARQKVWQIDLDERLSQIVYWSQPNEIVPIDESADYAYSGTRSLVRYAREWAALDALLREREEPCNGSCDISLARRQVGPDGVVPGNSRECAELWEAEASRLKLEVDEVRELCGPGGDGTARGRVESVLSRLAEAQREIERLASVARCLEGGRNEWQRRAIEQQAISVHAEARVRELEAVLREKELAAADAMALVLSHEGHIEKLEAQLQAEEKPVPYQHWKALAEERLFRAEAAEAQLTRLREGLEEALGILRDGRPGSMGGWHDSFVGITVRVETVERLAALLAEADKGGSDV